jgi:hypothetical protein
MSPEVYDLIQDLKSRLAEIKKHVPPQAAIMVALAEENVADIVKALEGE